MIKDLKTGNLYKEVGTLKKFLEVYPDDERKYKMGFGQRYRGKFVNDVPTDYFDWAVDSWNKELERNEMEKVFEGLTIEDCLLLENLAKWLEEE